MANLPMSALAALPADGLTFASLRLRLASVPDHTVQLLPPQSIKALLAGDKSCIGMGVSAKVWSVDVPDAAGPRCVAVKEWVHLCSGPGGAASSASSPGPSVTSKHLLASSSSSVSAANSMDQLIVPVEFAKEVLVLSRFQHANVVALEGYGVYKCPKAGCHSLHCVTLMRRCEGGSLREMLQQPASKLPWQLRLRILADIANGLSYLHSEVGGCKVLHRDIKADNVLIDRQFHALLCDVAFCKLAARPTQAQLSMLQDSIKLKLTPGQFSLFPATVGPGGAVGPIGTPGFIAPEVGQQLKYATSSDVYSFGVILLMVLSHLSSPILRPDGTAWSPPEGELLSTWPDDCKHIVDVLQEVVDSAGEASAPIEWVQAWNDRVVPRSVPASARVPNQVLAELLGLAKNATHFQHSKRPATKVVLVKLMQLRDQNPAPQQPKNELPGVAAVKSLAAGKLLAPNAANLFNTKMPASSAGALAPKVPATTPAASPVVAAPAASSASASSLSSSASSSPPTASLSFSSFVIPDFGNTSLFKKTIPTKKVAPLPANAVLDISQGMGNMKLHGAAASGAPAAAAPGGPAAGAAGAVAGASSSSAPHVVKAQAAESRCCVCFEMVPTKQCVQCDAGHATCVDCLRPHAQVCLEPAKLKHHDGKLPCPGHTNNNMPCTARPFQMEDVQALGDKQLIKEMFEACVWIIKNQPQTAAAPAQAAPAAASGAALPIEQQVAQRLDDMFVRCLVLQCPRCQTAWHDHDGCSAVQCAFKACQAHFCALCLAVAPNSKASHAHVHAAHGGHYQHDKFMAHHRPARTAKVIAFVQTLPQALRGPLLQAARDLLKQFGLDFKSIWTSVMGAAAPLPAAQADGSQACVVLWLDPNLASNAQLVERAKRARPDIRFVLAESQEVALQWLAEHRALLRLPDCLRIITNHALTQAPVPDEQHNTSGSSGPIVKMLLLRPVADPPVRMLVYCNYTYEHAKKFLAQFGRKEFDATRDEKEAFKFITWS